MRIWKNWKRHWKDEKLPSRFLPLELRKTQYLRSGVYDQKKKHNLKYEFENLKASLERPENALSPCTFGIAKNTI